MKYEKTSGGVLENFANLLQHILDTSTMSVALIPHVVRPNNSDLEPLTQLYQHFRDTGRVLLLPEANCLETKGFIGRCRMFIGARTHATIAAYSSGVPTLVVGYSVKARGIARDIFGSEDGLICPVQEMADGTHLIHSYQAMVEREEDLREKLRISMPAYCRAALRGVELLAPFR